MDITLSAEARAQAEYRDRLAELRRLWARKERSGTATQLELIAVLCDGDWLGRAAEVVEFVEGLSASERGLLTEALVGRLDGLDRQNPRGCESLTSLIATASRGLSVGDLARWRRPRLEQIERSFTVSDAWGLARLANLCRGRSR